MSEQWERRAASHARCGQIFLVLHHTLLLPSILVPPIVSLFDASSKTIKYTIVGASAATALSLDRKLEHRAFVHAKATRDYLLLAFDAQHGHEDLRIRIAQLLREAPMLPACLCTTVGNAGSRDGGAANNRDV